jgi:preprotein translocase subunit Sec61beta
MAKSDNKIQMPGAFGGLMRYDEEFKSRFMLSPAQVIGLLIVIAVFVVAMKFFFPIIDTSSVSGVPLNPIGG